MYACTDDHLMYEIAFYYRDAQFHGSQSAGLSIADAPPLWPHGCHGTKDLDRGSLHASDLPTISRTASHASRENCPSNGCMHMRSAHIRSQAWSKHSERVSTKLALTKHSASALLSKYSFYQIAIQEHSFRWHSLMRRALIQMALMRRALIQMALMRRARRSCGSSRAC